MTILIIVIFLIPLIIYVMKRKEINILNVILINGLLFFIFGYHVHEKAITPYLHLVYVFIMAPFFNKENTRLITVNRINLR